MVQPDRPVYSAHCSRDQRWWVADAPAVPGAEIRVRHHDEVEPRLRNFIAFLLDVDRDSFDIAMTVDPWIAAANERLLDVTSR